MTKRKTAPAAERGGAAAFDIDELLAMNQRSIDAVTRMNTRIYQNMMRVHTEFLDFTSRRLRADIEVAQKLTGGGNLDDAVEAVYGFQRKIISDYADEASELLKMSTSMAEDLIQEVEDDVKKVVGEGEVDVKDGAAEASAPVKMSTSMAEDLIQEVEDNLKEGAGEGEIDVKKVISDFQRKMHKISSDYADEASALVKMSTSMAGDLIQEVEDNLKEGVDEAAGAVAAEVASPEPQAAETGEEVAAKGPVITLNVPPKTTGEIDLQQVILDVLSGSGEAMTLAEIARKTGKKHFASLIGPMRSLREMGMVVKKEKAYRLDC
jgi:major membrane immunogen (membrane-anchored lipoprotein)